MIVQKLQILIDAQDRSTKKIKNIKRAIMGMSVAIAAASALSVKAYMAQERAEARLEHLTRQISDATDEQIASLKNQAKALQKVGVVGDEVALVGQSQLATFALNTDQINKLTPALLDMIVATKGVNSTQEDAITTANAVGRAIDGGAGALTRYGISLTDTQKELFSTANRMERVEMLSEILEGNFGGLNKAMRDTAEGGLKALKNDFGDLTEKMGEAIIVMGTPLLKRLSGISTAMSEAGNEVNRFAKVGATISYTFLTLSQGLAVGIQSLTAVVSRGLNTITLGLIPKLREFSKDQDIYLVETIKGFKELQDELQSVFETLDNEASAFSGLGVIAPMAMDNITEAAELTKKEISELEKRIDSLKNSLQDIIDIEKERFDQEKSYGTSIAEAYVEQENKIKDLRDRLNKETDDAESDRLAQELMREEEALRKRSHLLKLYYSQIQEERRQAGLTGFGQQVESIEAGQRTFETGQRTELGEIAKTYNFDFRGANISDINKLKASIIDALNRSSELASIGGE